MSEKIKKFKHFGTILGFLLILLLGWWFISSDNESLGFSQITEYKLLSPIKEVNSADIDQVMQAHLGGSFWGVNLNQIQVELTQLGWVYNAAVKRQWPNSLLINIQEQQPVVLWGDMALLNKFGEVFYPSDIQDFQGLVRLQGSKQNAQKLLEKLSELQKKFLELDWHIKKLTEQADGVWRIEFVQAPTLLLGQTNWQDRLNRFVVAYPLVNPEVRNSAEQIDLRYSNGFVIKQE